MDFREFLKKQEGLDESILGIAKHGWGAIKGVGNAAAGAMTMGDEGIARAMGQGERGRFGAGWDQFRKGVGQVFVGDDRSEKSTSPKLASPQEKSVSREETPREKSAVPHEGEQPDRWFVRRGGKKYGPFRAERILGMVRSGKVKPDDTLWKNGMSAWKRAGDISKAFPDSAAGTESGSPALPPKLRGLIAAYRAATNARKPDYWLLRDGEAKGPFALKFLMGHESRIKGTDRFSDSPDGPWTGWAEFRTIARTMLGNRRRSPEKILARIAMGYPRYDMEELKRALAKPSRH